MAAICILEPTNRSRGGLGLHAFHRHASLRRGSLLETCPGPVRLPRRSSAMMGDPHPAAMEAPPRRAALRGMVDTALWAVSVALLVATFVLSLGPAPPGLNAFFASDKLIHATGYAALTGSWLLAAVWRPGRGDGPFPRATRLVVIGAMVLGAGIEV